MSLVPSSRDLVERLCITEENLAYLLSHKIVPNESQNKDVVSQLVEDIRAYLASQEDLEHYKEEYDVDDETSVSMLSSLEHEARQVVFFEGNSLVLRKVLDLLRS